MGLEVGEGEEGGGAGVWARAWEVRCLADDPEQVSAPCTSHPMGDAGPRWSNEVQQGGETKKKIFAVNIMQT